MPEELEELLDDAVTPPDAPEPMDPAQALQGRWAEARILTRLAGAEVGGTLLVEGAAEAKGGWDVGAVGIKLDGEEIGFATGTANWSFLLDTTRLFDGHHSLKAVAYPVPKGSPFVYGMGWGEGADFSTLNHAKGVLLYERMMRVSGVAQDSWIFDLDANYSSLRVTLDAEPEGGNPAALTALAEVAYTSVPQQDAPDRTWVATYGAAQGSAVVSLPPSPELRRPGALALAAEYEGDGFVTLRVEALPLE